MPQPHPERKGQRIMNRKNEHITFKALRSLVRSTVGKNKPTSKYLRENEAPVAVSADGSMTVYPSGFVTYQSVTGSTVVNLAECGSYTYTFHDGKDDLPEKHTISAEVLEQMEWSVVVALQGEEQAAENNMNREGDRTGNRKYAYEDGTDPWEQLENQTEDDVLERIVRRDSIAELLDCLTDRQRQIVKLYFFEQLTQQQIADALGIRQQSVTDSLLAALKRMRKLF